MTNDENILIYLDDDVDIEELKFECPYCHQAAKPWKGCQHFVFSFETVNFEYIRLDKDFRDRALKVLRGKGYTLEELPCPLGQWAEDDDGKEMPSMHKLIPELVLTGYSYRASRHGSWTYIVGFQQT